MMIIKIIIIMKTKAHHEYQELTKTLMNNVLLSLIRALVTRKTLVHYIGRPRSDSHQLSARCDFFLENCTMVGQRSGEVELSG